VSQLPGPRRLALPLVVACALAIALAGPAEAASITSFARDDHLLGIDVSHWQGKPHWKSVRDAGVKFVIAKATEGQTHVDSQYARNKSRADALGLAFTAYHFARPDGTTNDARREANHFVRTAGLKGRHLLPVLDLEVTGGLGPKRLTEWTRTWLARVEALVGVKPIIYTSPSFWAERMGDTRWFADNGYQLWVAHWHVSDPRVPAANWGGRGWTLWQVTDCAKVPGISGCVDADLYAGLKIGRLRIKNNR
jgi:lysozyme